MTVSVVNSEIKSQLEQLHEESYGWTLNCCTGDSSCAEDVLQTVYLKILEGKARFDGKSTFKTWLFSVIRKTAADEHRRMMVRTLWFGASERNLELMAAPDDLDEIIEKEDMQARFQRALEELPRRQREVLQLVFYHDSSLADAAVIMGISIGSARTHYERGKKQLRLLLKDFQ